jgi:quinol monooxygenase YgiN
MPRPGLVIKFTTRPENAESFAGILSDAVARVEQEPGTTPWMAMRANEDPNTFFVVDLHADAAALDAHMNGAAAALVLGEGGKLLEGSPEVAITSLISGKAV